MHSRKSICSILHSPGPIRGYWTEHSAVEAQLVLGYDGPEVRRVVYIMQGIFWTSVPLFAVSLAVIWPQSALPWPVSILWLVVMASSAFLTVQGNPFAPGEPPEQEDERGETQRNLEWLVYPTTLFLACYPFSFQLAGFSFPF